VEGDAGRDAVQLQEGRELDEREQCHRHQPDPRDQPFTALARLDDLSAAIAEPAANATEDEAPAPREIAESGVRGARHAERESSGRSAL